MEAAYTYTIHLLLLCCTCTAGIDIMTTHSSGIKAEIAPVCSGDQLELTCTLTPGRVLEWEITLMSPEDMTLKQVVAAVTPIFPAHTVTVNGSILFTFSRISPPDSQPLISRLLINSATSVINGTEVVCADRETRNSSSTTVNVVDNNADDSSKLTDIIQAVHIVNFTSSSELRESTYVILSVSLQLNGTNPSFPYQISVIPEECNISVTNVVLTFELRVQYDTLYNVSVVVCGESSEPLIGLYYSKCDTSTAIIDYDDYLQGTFSNATDCPPAQTSQAPIRTGFESEPTGFADATLGAILGILFTVFGTATLCIVIGIILLVKRKGLKNLDRRRPQNECQETTAEYSSLHHDQGPKNATKGLVYAEVDQVSHQHQRNIPLSFLNLDDTPIEYAQINHKHHTDKTNGAQKALPLMESEPIDHSLSVNLDNLLIQLRPQVTAKWYQFGKAAGIQRDVLDNFAKQCSPNDCVMEMLDYWIRNNKELPTWKDVAKILKEINLTQLGHDIEQIYKTGELPVKVDMDWIPQIHPVESDFTESSLPAIPPKTVMAEDWTGENSAHREQKYSIVQTESEASVPALPPKPNNWCMTNVPARPPKPIPKSS